METSHGNYLTREKLETPFKLQEPEVYLRYLKIPGVTGNCFFFAAGSGIIPVFSLIKTVLYSHPHIKVVLIYSNSSIEQTAFFSELTQLQLIFRMTLHVEFLFSNSEYAFRARLNADLIGIFLKTLSVDALENCLYYLCGPEAYMRLCTFVLQSHHVPPQNIKKEIFHTARPANRVEPPDQRAHTIERRTTWQT